MADIGSVYAALDPTDNDLWPGEPEHALLFETVAVPAAIWLAFERSALCDRLQQVATGGLLGAFEECWFDAPQLVAVIALIEADSAAAPPEMRDWFGEVLALARRAQARGSRLTFAIGG